MTGFDLTDTIAPRSDQLNAEDLLAGPRTVTITEVRKGASPEQPVDIVLAEFGKGRPFKPSKTVRRILVMAWGAEATAYTGRRMTLYRDPAVRFGGSEVGGIRVSHLSHIDKALKLALTETRGKRAQHVITPLADSEPDEVSVRARTVAEMRAMFERKGIPEGTWLAGVNRIINADVTAIEAITEAEAQKVIAALKSRPDAKPAPVVTTDQPDIPGTEQP